MFLPLMARTDPRVSWGLAAGLVALGLISVAALSSVRHLWTSDEKTPVNVGGISG
ncbi:hypothetical protein [Micromonospora sp. NPDC092111]|uniref:hypothetical protein n=1 Tax=Micromonospora sp. NPDC092111 TaxID=3364289 RepID=UPI00381183EC